MGPAGVPRQAGIASPALSRMAETAGTFEAVQGQIMARYEAHWTYSEMAAWLHEVYGVVVSRYTVRGWCHRWLKGGSVAVKRPLKEGC